MYTGDFLEMLSQRILVGIILVGRLGVLKLAAICNVEYACCRSSKMLSTGASV